MRSGSWRDDGVGADDALGALDRQLDRVQPEALVRKIMEPRAVGAQERKHSVKRPQPTVHGWTLRDSSQCASQRTFPVCTNDVELTRSVAGAFVLPQVRFRWPIGWS
jgi:hypothetical protein